MKGGIEATQTIRRQRDTGTPWIVALTADAMLDNRQQCLDAGMNEVLTKPVSYEDLYKLLQQFVTSKKFSI